MNGEFLPYMEQNKGRVSEVMLWNLERPSGSGGLHKYTDDNKEYMEAGHLDGVIVSDRKLAYDTGFKHVPLGSHRELGVPGSKDDRLSGYDLIHLSCYSNHRSWLFHEPNNPKIDLYGLVVARNSWVHARHKALTHSRFMLNIHQDEFLYIEPLRFSLAAAYGLPILSEQCFDVYPYAGDYWVSKDDDIKGMLRSVWWVRDMIAYEERYYPAGMEMRRYMTTVHSFRTCLEAYL
jgi:hypothetical protein